MFADYLPAVRDALGQLPSEAVAASNIYVDSRMYGAGAAVPVGRQTVTAPEESLLLFIDLAPSANWGHPCKYVLIGTEDGKIQTFDAQFPPPREHLRVVKRAEGAGDWTLLTKSKIEG